MRIKGRPLDDVNDNDSGHTRESARRRDMHRQRPAHAVAQEVHGIPLAIHLQFCDNLNDVSAQRFFRQVL